jgi:hypothetical protein
MTATRPNKPTRKSRLRLLIAGVQKQYPTGSLLLAGQTLTTSQLVQVIQQDIDASDATDKAYADWISQVQVERNSHQKVAPLLRALRSQVLAHFGDTKDAASTLAAFGYLPRKVTAVPSDTKADAVAKGRATRTARHTMGKRQKASVKGTVSPTAPVTSPPSQAVPVASVAGASAPKASAPAPGPSVGATTPHGT